MKLTCMARVVPVDAEVLGQSGRHLGSSTSVPHPESYTASAVAK